MRSLRLFAKGFMSARAYGCVGDPAVFERGVLHKPGQATPDAGPDAPSLAGPSSQGLARSTSSPPSCTVHDNGTVCGV